MNVSKLISCAAVAAAVLSGCFFGGKALDVVYYAPELPAAAGGNKYVCGAVINTSGAGRDFVFRNADGTIRIDSARRWLTMPEQMLKNSMQMNFSGIGADAVAVNAELLKFEFSGSGSHLEAAAVFRTGKVKRVYVERVEVKDGNFSRAAAAVFDRLIRKFVQEQKVIK